jgi:hypothetical protein
MGRTLYLIGGAGRCGKTELSLRLLRAHSLPIFSTDLFMSFMADIDAGRPVPPTVWTDEKWFDLAAGVERTRARFREHLPKLLWGVSGVYESGIFEGCEIVPDDIPGLAASAREWNADVRAVFLVRNSVKLDALTGVEARHDWLQWLGPSVRDAMVEDIERHSAETVESADRLGMPVVDVSRDFDAAMTSAAAALGLPV